MSATVFRSSAHALITGGASGVGLAVTRLCLKHGMKVSIVDVNASTLEAAKKNLSGDVQCVQADVGEKESWKKIRGEVGDVDFLVLNAGIGGIGMKAGWGEDEGMEKIMHTNLYGVMNGLNAYVPSFQTRSSGAIVITGSKQGITNPPGNPSYNASKAAVKALAEHLSYDLKDTGVDVHLLVPGWTFTGLTGNTPGANKEKPAGAWTPEQVADYMFQKMSDKKFYIICPDNDVSEETDKKRMMWSVSDMVKERPPLTRWRPEFKEEAEEWMAKRKV